MKKGVRTDVTQPNSKGGLLGYQQIENIVLKERIEESQEKKKNQDLELLLILKDTLLELHSILVQFYLKMFLNLNDYSKLLVFKLISILEVGMKQPKLLDNIQSIQEILLLLSNILAMILPEANWNV